MPTLSSSLCRKRPRTPIERAAEPPPPVEEKDKPIFGPPADPETMTLRWDRKGRARDTQYQREKLYGWAMSRRFFDWLVLYTAYCRVPLDEVLLNLEGLAACLEIHLVAIATWPHLYPIPEPEEVDEGPEVVAPRVEREATDAGLTVNNWRRKRARPAPSLPGCHGTPNGQSCQNLRRFGELYCPSCRRHERQRMRDAVTR